MKTKLKILLVEDDVFLMRLYSAKFVEEGFEVRGAAEGREVIAEAKAFKPSLILLDIMLPDEDGLAVLKRLKSDRTIADIPVVLMTNLSRSADREQGLIHGAVDYWIKMHFEPAEIVAKAKKILETR